MGESITKTDEYSKPDGQGNKYVMIGKLSLGNCEIRTSKERSTVGHSADTEFTPDTVIAEGKFKEIVVKCGGLSGRDGQKAMRARVIPMYVVTYQAKDMKLCPAVAELTQSGDKDRLEERVKIRVIK